MNQIDKTINLSYKIGSKYKGKQPNFFYAYSTKDEFIKTFFSKLSGKEIVYFCFMSSAISNGMERENLYKLYINLVKNVFVFSILEVTSSESLQTCSYCGGDGEVSCGNCDGSGEIDCGECDGNGEIETDDNEYESCSYCDGDGQIKCEECSNGYVTCDNCDGYGEESMPGYVDITVSEFVSYDAEIFNILEVKDENTKITDALVNMIYKSDLTFQTDVYHRQTDDLESKVESGDYYFSYFESTPEFNRNSNGSISNNLPLW